jgi:hypothetical protein
MYLKNIVNTGLAFEIRRKTSVLQPVERAVAGRLGRIEETSAVARAAGGVNARCTRCDAQQ